MERALRQAAPTIRRERIPTLEVAREHYYVPEAAALLYEAATDPEPSERRIRACKALLCLSMDEDLLEWDLPLVGSLLPVQGIES
ncbi:MAG: hypothetical protein KJ067_20785 [Vicinamibacteria bacterium]|nr:hypothetical protein [Vicinamibacteria bacterium]